MNGTNLLHQLEVEEEKRGINLSVQSVYETKRNFWSEFADALSDLGHGTLAELRERVEEKATATGIFKIEYFDEAFTEMGMEMTMDWEDWELLFAHPPKIDLGKFSFDIPREENFTMEPWLIK